jgi:hypothetical protein
MAPASFIHQQEARTMIRRIVPALVGLTLVVGGPASFARAAMSQAAAYSHAADNGGGNDGGGDHGCGNDRGQGNDCAPEAPFPAGIPVAGLAVFGGYVWLLRRRSGSPQPITSIGVD